ncbi:DUF6624 domain-containing protein [Streptomyces cyaneofuscatus]|uniref:DUF6624 domain-containing protein n=1 Tax=Streptomyces cyaneofuscatus TaxID=66883 RepID=UPI00340D949A
MNAGLPHTATPDRPDLAKQLTDRVATADEYWARLIRLQLTDEQINMGHHVDHANAEILKRITGDHGWPGHRLVGEDGATAAWLLALHADVQPDFQRDASHLMHQAAREGDASLRQWAHLHDRCLLHLGRGQDYGTQYRVGTTGPEPQPVRDPSSLGERRVAVGLPTAASALETLRRRLAAEPVPRVFRDGAPPTDPSGPA